MTLLLHHASSHAAGFSWHLAGDELWVGNNRGAFAGTIDPQDAHFYVRDHFGQYLGDYPNLAAARQRLEVQAHEFQANAVAA